MPARRLVTVPGYLLASALWLGLAPVWLPLALVADRARSVPRTALRSAVLVGVYLCCEAIGIVASGGLWAWGKAVRVDAARWEDLHFRLEAWWGSTLFRAVVRLFGLRLEVEGDADADLGRGPYLLLVRHASTADTLLASGLVSAPHGLRLRYVLKRELLWDPCLDIVGQRLPNAFVDRASQDGRREVERVRELGRGLGSRDGVLIYPEGTRFSQAKRARALERLRREGDERMLEYARSLACVLPPRSGGTLGLLEACPRADVVVCAHTGFEGTASLADIWSGALVGRTIRVQFRRTARHAVPAGRDERVAWLLDEWRRVGAWIERQASVEDADPMARATNP